MPYCLVLMGAVNHRRERHGQFIDRLREKAETHAVRAHVVDVSNTTNLIVDPAGIIVVISCKSGTEYTPSMIGALRTAVVSSDAPP